MRNPYDYNDDPYAGMSLSEVQREMQRNGTWDYELFGGRWVHLPRNNSLNDSNYQLKNNLVNKFGAIKQKRAPHERCTDYSHRHQRHRTTSVINTVASISQCASLSSVNADYKRRGLIRKRVEFNDNTSRNKMSDTERNLEYMAKMLDNACQRFGTGAHVSGGAVYTWGVRFDFNKPHGLHINEIDGHIVAFDKCSITVFRR